VWAAVSGARNALLLSVYPLMGRGARNARMMASSSVLLACPVYVCGWRISGTGRNTFTVNDFTVTYVANNSNTASGVVSRGEKRRWNAA